MSCSQYYSQIKDLLLKNVKIVTCEGNFFISKRASWSAWNAFGISNGCGHRFQGMKNSLGRTAKDNIWWWRNRWSERCRRCGRSWRSAGLNSLPYVRERSCGWLECCSPVGGCPTICCATRVEGRIRHTFIKNWLSSILNEKSSVSVFF